MTLGRISPWLPHRYRERMAHDEEVAERVRATLADATDVVEKKMFGGLAFLVSGSMAVAVGDDDLLVRVDPQERPTLLLEDGVRAAVMGSREMRGWVEVDHSAVAEDDALAAWITRGRRVAETLGAR